MLLPSEYGYSSRGCGPLGTKLNGGQASTTRDFGSLQRNVARKPEINAGVQEQTFELLSYVELLWLGSGIKSAAPSRGWDW